MRCAVFFFFLKLKDADFGVMIRWISLLSSQPPFTRDLYFCKKSQRISAIDALKLINKTMAPVESSFRFHLLSSMLVEQTSCWSVLEPDTNSKTCLLCRIFIFATQIFLPLLFFLHKSLQWKESVCFMHSLFFLPLFKGTHCNDMKIGNFFFSSLDE